MAYEDDLVIGRETKILHAAQDWTRLFEDEQEDESGTWIFQTRASAIHAKWQSFSGVPHPGGRRTNFFVSFVCLV